MKRHRRFGIRRHRLWTFDAATKDALHELRERDKEIMIGHVERAGEPALMVVARGDRAVQLKNWLAAMGLINKEFS